MVRIVLRLTFIYYSPVLPVVLPRVSIWGVSLVARQMKHPLLTLVWWCIGTLLPSMVLLLTSLV